MRRVIAEAILCMEMTGFACGSAGTAALFVMTGGCPEGSGYLSGSLVAMVLGAMIAVRADG